MKLTCHTPAQTQDSEVTVGSGRYRTKLASRHESKCPPDAVLSCQMELPRGASRSGHTRGGLGSVTIRHQPLGESLALREQKESTEGCPWGNGLNVLRRRSPERAHTVIVVPERLGFRPTPARAATCRPSLRGHGSADGPPGRRGTLGLHQTPAQRPASTEGRPGRPPRFAACSVKGARVPAWEMPSGSRAEH